VTSPIEAIPQYVIKMPGPGWPPILAAAFTAAFFLLLTIKLLTIASVCGVLAVFFILVWTWGLDPGHEKGNVAIGSGLSLPTYMSGPSSHSWWAMIVLMLVAGSLFLSYVFSYLFLWTVSPQAWPPQGSPPLPAIAWPGASALLLLAGSVLMTICGRNLSQPGKISMAVNGGIFLALACLAGALVVEIAGHVQSGLSPVANSHGAMVYMSATLFGQLVLAVVIMGLFTIARSFAGKLDRERRVTFDNTMLLYQYTVGQSLLGLALVHGFPRLMA
jgi:cytochrome c oxidase subunit I+III